MAVSSSVSAHARRLRTKGFTTRLIAMWGQWAKQFGAPTPPRSARDFMTNAAAIAKGAGVKFEGFAFGPFPNTGVDPMVDPPDTHSAFADWCVSQGFVLGDWSGWFWHLKGPLGTSADSDTWLAEIRQHAKIMRLYLDHGVLLPGPVFRYDLIHPPGDSAAQIKLAAPRVREAARIVSGETGGVLGQEPEFAHAAHGPFDVVDLHDAVGLPVSMHGIIYDIAHAHNIGAWGVKQPNDQPWFTSNRELAALWGTRTVRLHFAGTARGETDGGLHAATAIHAPPTMDLSEEVVAELTRFHATGTAVLDNCMMEFDEQDGCLAESLRIMGAVTNNRGLPLY